MNKFFMFCLTGLILTSCVSTTERSSQTNIAQAIKTEGEIFLRQGNYTAALKRLLEAEKSLPDDPGLYNSLGLAYMGKKDDLAESAFKKALELKPDFMEATNNLGGAYLRQGKWDQAISTFKSLLDDLLYPTPHFPLSNIGWAYLGKNEFTLAETYFKKALDLFPDFVTASHGLAQVYIRTGRLNKAEEYIKYCLKKSYKAAILYADLAQVYETLGMPDKARKSWRAVQQYAPTNSSLKRKAEKKISGPL